MAAADAPSDKASRAALQSAVEAGQARHVSSGAGPVLDARPTVSGRCYQHPGSTARRAYLDWEPIVGSASRAPGNAETEPAGDWWPRQRIPPKPAEGIASCCAAPGDAAGAQHLQRELRPPLSPRVSGLARLLAILSDGCGTTASTTTALPDPEWASKGNWHQRSVRARAVLDRSAIWLLSRSAQWATGDQRVLDGHQESVFALEGVEFQYLIVFE